MNLAERHGVRVLSTSAGSVRLLSGPPMIAPARQFVFPVAVPGEEEALGRGSVYVDVTSDRGSAFLAQCALGYTGEGVANGLWASPVAGEVLIVAGGYAYALALPAPETTVMLPLRPVTEVVSDQSGGRLILVGYHHVFVREATGECWQSQRLSWEGVTVTGLEGSTLCGMGWDMTTDEEIPFSLNLSTRGLSGGGYRQG